MADINKKILHYALGFPPYRTGGLTKYCIDLMLTQKEQGYEPALLWPGRIHIFNKMVRIYEHRKWNGLGSYEIINPLPISLDEGIANIPAYTAATDGTAYLRFLLGCKPQAVHVHTLMGLHCEFLRICKELEIRVVFTTHDYYGLCPKVMLFRDGHTCDNDHGCNDCVKCNQTALSLKKIIAMQSLPYRILKNTFVVKKLRKMHRNTFFKNMLQDISGNEEKEQQASEYQKLRNYYVAMLEKMDFIHFNSTISENIYRRYVQPGNCKVAAITHRDISDHRKIKDFSSLNLRLTYLGTANPFKGFFFLLSTLDAIWNQGINNFELHVYTPTSERRPYITYKQNAYSYSQLGPIFDNTDLLVVPSKGYDSFGFTVLEALSYGVPALVSKNVGAKDLVSEHFIYDDLKDKILQIIRNRTILENENERIVSAGFTFKDMGDLYM